MPRWAACNDTAMLRVECPQARNLSPKDQTGLQKGDIGIAVKIRQPAIQNSLRKMISAYPYSSTVGIVVFYLRFSISPVMATMGQLTKIKALCL